MAEITRLLQASRSGDETAADQLLPLIYADLRRLSASILRGERPGHTLQPTALVHEIYLRMFQGTPLPAGDRSEFFALAARVMRQVLVDHARRKNAHKRGSGQIHEELQDDFALTPQQSEEILATHEALDQLAELDQRQAKMIEMHYFGGLGVEEIADHFGASSRTVKRELQTGRLFLRQQLGEAQNHEE